MNTAQDILTAIERMKLDIPSKDYVEVRMRDLETLYSYIKEIEKISDGRAKAINNLSAKLMKSKIKDLVIKPRLDEYV